MAAKPVEFHEDADAEYDHALGWYLERSQSAASDFADELNRAVEMIADAPIGGRPECTARPGFFFIVFRLL